MKPEKLYAAWGQRLNCVGLPAEMAGVANGNAWDCRLMGVGFPVKTRKVSNENVWGFRLPLCGERKKPLYRRNPPLSAVGQPTV